MDFLRDNLRFRTLMKETSSSNGAGDVRSASCIVEELDSNNNPLDGFTIVSLKFDPVIDSQNNNDSFIANEVKERIDDNRTFAEQVNEEILSHRAIIDNLARENTYDIVIVPL